MVRNPNRLAVRATRQAISPRLAIRTDLNISGPAPFGPILAWRRRLLRCRRLCLWTFWWHGSACSRLFTRRVGGGCAGLFLLLFRRRRLSIHDADRRNRGRRGEIVFWVERMGH